MLNYQGVKKTFLGDDENRIAAIQHMKKIVATLIGVYFLFFFVVHKNSPWLQKNMLFLHFAKWPTHRDFSNGERYGVKGCKNFYLTTKDNVKIGVWQILPQSLIKEEGNTSESFDEGLGDGKPIVVYVHGNSGTRGTYHRVQLYNLLQRNDFHVVTFDYRGYGDSSSRSPDEVGVVEDTSTVLKWVFERKKNSQVYVWGHSLGTGISARAIAELEQSGLSVDGLILEAPFNNLGDAIRNHPLSFPIRHMVGYDYFFVQPIQNNGITFKTDEYLSQSKIPVLILHAINDWILPACLGQKLYQTLLKNRPNAEDNVKYVEAGKSGSYGHKYICDAPKLSNTLQLFVDGKLSEIESSLD